MPDDNEMMSDQLVLIEALYGVMLESKEAEIVRVALAGLTNSSAGMQYLLAHPVRA